MTLNAALHDTDIDTDILARILVGVSVVERGLNLTILHIDLLTVETNPF